MMRQIRLLTKISLYGMFGLNELRFTKDTRKRVKAGFMAVLWLLLIVMLAGYVGLLSFGLVAMGMGQFVPAILGMAVSLLVFFFTVFKAGPVLFDRKVYEKQIAMPVTVRAVIVSRFLSMYITDMLLGLLVLLPGMVVYGVMVRPGLFFWGAGLAAGIFLPLLPMTAASVVGALIAGIASRWRHKNLAAILLTLTFICFIMVGSMGMGGMDESQLNAVAEQVSAVLEAQIRNVYPPAVWVADAMVFGDIGKLVLFLGVSLGSFLLFLEILQHFYVNICTLLSAREARGNYRMKALQAKSLLGTMVERELRHYFSSTVYVVNTLAGEVLMVLMAVAILVLDFQTIEQNIGIPGVVGKALPILLGCIPMMMPMTACSISLEGKQWWMLQTLPLTRRDMVWSKVAANVLVALPFYLVSEVLVLIALRPGWADAVCLLAVPAVYIVFGARLGLAVNELLPLMEWESEVRVVKQSASSMVSMLAIMVTAVVPIMILMTVPGISSYLVYGVLTAVLVLGTWGMNLGNKGRIR